MVGDTTPATVASPFVNGRLLPIVFVLRNNSKSYTSKNLYIYYTLNGSVVRYSMEWNAQLFRTLIVNYN